MSDLNVLLTVALTLVMFGVIIFAHEGGHLLCAKACGVYVEEFSVGMGPLLFSFKKGDTQYSLRLLPIGGYCKMPGEDGESDYPNGFDKKNVPQRMLVVAGGALFNILFALILFVIAFMGMGTATTEPLIGEVSEDYPAYAAGFESGDRVTAIDGKAVASWDDMTGVIRSSAGKELTFSVDRDGESVTLAVTPDANDDGSGVIGVVAARVPMSPFAAIKTGFVQTYAMTKLVLVSLWQMITGAIGLELAGPVGVGQMVGEAAHYGFYNFLVFVAVISVNLGVVNMLPLPALDGSRLVFLLVEGIRRKPVSAGVEGAIHFAGFVLLMGLLIVITYFDIARIVG